MHCPKLRHVHQKFADSSINQLPGACVASAILRRSLTTLLRAGAAHRRLSTRYLTVQPVVTVPAADCASHERVQGPQVQHRHRVAALQCHSKGEQAHDARSRLRMSRACMCMDAVDPSVLDILQRFRPRELGCCVSYAH